MPAHNRYALAVICAVFRRMRITISNIKINIDSSQTEENILRTVARKLKINESEISDFEIRKRSIDARHKDDIRYVYTIDCEVRSADKLINNRRISNVSRSDRVIYKIPKRHCNGKPIIIGAGPAGLFCAYICVLAGLSPVIIERGSSIDERSADVEDFWRNGALKPDSNVQFGEGGAGAFSDGKLNTLITDKLGMCRFVLETFVRFGAPVNILYDAKPHLGTDVLKRVISSMRRFLVENGTEFKFNTCVTDFLISGDKSSNGCKRRIMGVSVKDSDGSYEIHADRVVLAIGHSARDTFKLLYDRNIEMSAKAFAVGFRVEHPRRFIDISQYGLHGADILPAAPYKLTAKLKERGVYSFCMCPGGYVVNSSSEPGMLAVNGMSYSKRDGDNSNSAIIVTVTPEDFPSMEPLSGVEFQRLLERRAYEAGRGSIPVQRFGEFVSAVYGSKVPPDLTQNKTDMKSGYDFDLSAFTPKCKGTYRETDISNILPPEFNRCIIEGMMNFEHSIHGFANPDIYMSGVESRTSSPVRIERTKQGESVSVKGLYPCGEGAGYAGGITSAAMDGIHIAECLMNA